MKFRYLFPLFAFLLFALAVPAHAGFMTIEKSATITSGTSATSFTLTMNNVKIENAIVLVPSIDATDTATLSMQALFNTTKFTPLGWTDKAVPNASTNGVVTCLSTPMSYISGDQIIFTIRTKTAQAAPRTFTVRFPCEN